MKKRRKFDGIETKFIHMQLPTEQLAFIDGLAADVRFLQNGKPCPRLVVIREALAIGLKQIGDFVETTKRRQAL